MICFFPIVIAFAKIHLILGGTILKQPFLRG